MFAFVSFGAVMPAVSSEPSSSEPEEQELDGTEDYAEEDKACSESSEASSESGEASSESGDAEGTESSEAEDTESNADNPGDGDDKLIDDIIGGRMQILRSKWQLDGCDSIDACVVRLREFIKELEDLKDEGWELAGPVDDDYGHLIKRPECCV